MTPASGAAAGDRGAGRWNPADAGAGDRTSGDRAGPDRPHGDRGAGGQPDAPRGGAWAGDRRTPSPVGAGGRPGSAEEGEGVAVEPEVEEVPAGAILTDVAALTAERDEYLTALQRLQADFENYRKRVQRQQEEQALRAATDLVGKVLPVLDTLDLARAHLGGDEGGEEAKALEQARAQLLDVLAKEGLDRVDQAGVAFDPVVHDAVAHAPADPASAGGAAESEERAAPDGPSGSTVRQDPADGGVTVDEVLRAGYRWRGQVLRPAMVRVRG